MSKQFTARDLRQLTEVMRLLLAPLDYALLDDWRRAVNEALFDVLGADRLWFIMYAEGAFPYFTEQHQSKEVPEVVRSYEQLVLALGERWNITQRQVQFGAWETKSLWGDGLLEMQRSAYYHEFVVPFRYYDRMGLTVRDANGLTADFRCNRERSGGQPLGRRALAIFSLLRPAFRAGVDIRLRASAYRTTLESMVDLIPDGCVLSSPAGNELHRNEAMKALLLEESPHGAATLQNAVERSMAAVRSSISPPGLVRRQAPPADMATTISTPRARYRVRSTTMGPGMAPGEAFGLTIIQRMGVEALSDAEMAHVFLLTKRETEVARLLATGRTNERVATALGISQATARRHTERVLAKLDVHSRQDVRARLVSHDGVVPATVRKTRKARPS